MNITIIGAGIAGCSAAIVLAAAGYHVHVLEKQRSWTFKSSGTFLWISHSAHELQWMISRPNLLR
ncbi:MAG: FAD-dependent oxidoreductase [Gammaproteobacteria bacterium]|nr:FAD-dependent oxidoreductase [Gammaproteobacteria bacterium]